MGPGRWGVPAVLVALLLVGGCAPSPRSGQAREAALAFVAADTASACALLAPATLEAVERDRPCPEELAADNLPASGEVTRVEIAGNGAQVKLGDQTLFLALFDDGWRITAAGCSHAGDDPAEPYDCTVKGG